MVEKELVKEKVPMFIVYKQDGKITSEVMGETSVFELYGFLKVLIKDMEWKLLDSMEDFESG